MYILSQPSQPLSLVSVLDLEDSEFYFRTRQDYISRRFDATKLPELFVCVITMIGWKTNNVSYFQFENCVIVNQNYLGLCFQNHPRLAQSDSSVAWLLISLCSTAWLPPVSTCCVPSSLKPQSQLEPLWIIPPYFDRCHQTGLPSSESIKQYPVFSHVHDVWICSAYLSWGHFSGRLYLDVMPLPRPPTELTVHK